ncbi:MAG: MerR family transcriptional regulator [Lachnospiraceae bacterium]|nr:MerR family transcriptional regulator [Lachnospiraceae bacterium]
MTIKELEQKSGMTRSNIRFYETEGLLAPERGANGYRNYSEEDLAVLLRIKLLRSLHLPLDEVKAVHTGARSLRDALADHLVELKWQQSELHGCEAICQTLQEDRAEYATLDAERYLEEMAAEPQASEWEADQVPQVTAIWRRFFARNLDLLFYTAIWLVVLEFVLHINVSTRSSAGELLDAAVELGLWFLLEPLQLMLFGTTLGKWLFGLHVEHVSGRRLTFVEGVKRTWSVFWRGMGLQIPIYGWYRWYKSAVACEDGEVLEWEQDNRMAIKDMKKWRIAAYIGVTVGIYLLMVVAAAMGPMPRNRGNITVEEFAENFNQLSDYYGVFDLVDLGPTGEWVDVVSEGEIIVVNPGGGSQRDLPAKLTFSEKDGVMTGLTLELQMENCYDVYAPIYDDEMILFILSYVKAQKSYWPWLSVAEELDELIAYIQDYPYSDIGFQHNCCGVKLRCEVEAEGYEKHLFFGALKPMEGVENSYSFKFTMEKQ